MKEKEGGEGKRVGGQHGKKEHAEVAYVKTYKASRLRRWV